jgi:hypothetical protein
MSLLPPAYRGAPYRQPPRPPRRYRAMRIMRRVLIVTAVVSLFVITGVLLMQGHP